MAGDTETRAALFVSSENAALFARERPRRKQENALEGGRKIS